MGVMEVIPHILSGVGALFHLAAPLFSSERWGGKARHEKPTYWWRRKIRNAFSLREKKTTHNFLRSSGISFATSPASSSAHGSSSTEERAVKRTSASRNMDRIRICRTVHQMQMLWSRTIST